MRMRTTTALLCILSLGFASSCLAEMPAKQPSIKNIEKNIRHQLADVPIDGVRPSPIKGLYEIRSGSNIYYADATGKYLLAGNIFDTATKKNLTAARREQILRIDWKQLPLNKAIVSGKPDGTPIAVFTDPDCPYCRKLEKELKKVKTLKVYTFLYPLEQLHPKARAKSRAIWCSKDRHKALQAVMLKNKTLSKADCKTPVASIIALGNKLGIRGTPSIIARDGRRISGLLPAEKLQAWAATAR